MSGGAQVLRYSGFFYEVDGDDGCWVAVIGNGHWTRSELQDVLQSVPAGNVQRVEFERAFAEIPEDHVAPTKAQRRKIVPAEGSLAD